jgi:hypothetical protein
MPQATKSDPCWPQDKHRLVPNEDNRLSRGDKQITRALQEEEATKREAEAARRAMANRQEELDNRQAALLAQQQEQDNRQAVLLAQQQEQQQQQQQQQQQEEKQQRRRRQQQRSVSSTPFYWGGDTYDVRRLSKTRDADVINALQKCCSTDKLYNLGVGRDVHDKHLAGGK